MFYYQQQNSNNNGQYKITEYKTSPYTCDGRGCNNAATFCAKVIYLNKPCWLCLVHVEDLKNGGMIESNFDDVLNTAVEGSMKVQAQQQKIMTSEKT